MNPDRLLSHVRAVRRELARQSLHEFVQQAWPIVEAGTPFIDGWHIRGVCRHLEAVSHGRLGDMIINIPSGCMKTLLTSVFWPCWVWIDRPQTRWMFASYSREISGRDSQSRRRILGSAWYRQRWPVRLLPGENRRMRFHNSEGGWMLATSIGGPATGEHPDFVVVDDPHTAREAERPFARLIAHRWWESTIGTRGVVRGVKKVVVMQRLHRQDLSGMLLEKPGFVHLCLPMEFDESLRMPKTPLDWTDPRTRPNELLWPEGFSLEKLAGARLGMPDYDCQAQFQQHPLDQDPAAEFPASYFGPQVFFDEWPDAASTALTVMSLDPSLGRGEASDFSAFVVLRLDRDGHCWIDADLERRDVSRIVARAVDLAREHRPLSLGVEANGFQCLLCDPLQEAFARADLLVNLVPVVNSLTKQIRIRRLSPQLARRELHFLKSSPGARRLVEQLGAFPIHRYDDGPDALEIALRLAANPHGPADDVTIDLATA